MNLEGAPPNTLPTIFASPGQMTGGQPPTQTAPGGSDASGDQLESDGFLSIFDDNANITAGSEPLETPGLFDPDSSDLFETSGTDTEPGALASSIEGDEIFRALNIPGELSTGPIDVSGLFTSFGDQAGIALQASIYAESAIYNQIQETLAIIRYLDVAPNGTSPNPNFSYIDGQPPYGEASPEQQAQQEEVFAQLRVAIQARLQRVVDQLVAADEGLQQQKNLAQSAQQKQTRQVQQFVQQANQAGQQRRGGL